MLDVAFINLISAGLAKLDPSRRDTTQPDAAPISDEDLIHKLLAAAPEPTGQLISQCAKHLWQSCQTVGLPAELAEPHVTALPALIHRATLTTADRNIIFGPVDDIPDHSLSDLSKRIVAPGAADLAADGLDETILIYLLEAFFNSLKSSRGLILELQPVLKELIASKPTAPVDTPAVPSDAAVTLAKIERADALGISVPILEAITISLINLTKSADLRQADLLAATAQARELIETFETLSQLEPTHAEPFAQALNQFNAGRIHDCNHTLATVEDHFVRQSIDVTPHDNNFANLALRIRSLRAGLHVLEGSFVKAARYYGFAQRYITRANYVTRWDLSALEAHYYELAAFHYGTPDGLTNAARTCTSALAVIPDEHPSAERAAAQTELARFLVLLGEKEQQSSRFELAAQLLTDAQSFFASIPNSTDHLRAGALRADALARLGETLQKPDVLEQAAFIYQSIIEAAPSPSAATEDAAFAESASNLPTRQALALAAAAALSQQEALREAAVATILDTLPDIIAQQSAHNSSGFARCLLAARCHLVLAAWHIDHGEHAAGATHHKRAVHEFDTAGFDAAAQSVPDSATSSDVSDKTERPLTDSEANAA